MQTKTLGELAKYVGGQVIGDSNMKISEASSLGRAEKGEISFLTNAKYENQLKTTKAGAVIVGKEIPGVSVPLLVAEDPYYAFMQIMVLLHGHRKHKKIGVSTHANISDTAKIGSDCHIHNFVTIDDDVEIGDGCIIYPGTYIGKGTQIGNDCIIYPNVTVYDGCKIGNRVIINANSSVGEDGFGFATHKGAHHKIPQAGIAVIEDDVEIGVCCAIERATLGATVIGQGSKIGDLVTIGHGAKIGQHCLIVAQVGIAGSTTLGNYCVLGGQVGVAGHINIGNQVTVGAQAGVASNVPDGKALFGTPAFDAYQAKRAYSVFKSLPEMRKKIKTMEKRLAELEKTDNAQQ